MSKYSKFIAAALAFLGVIVAAGVLDGDAQAWASAIVSGLGAAAVYFVPAKGYVTPADEPEAGPDYIIKEH